MPEQERQLPALYVFAISHFCEKARWALDYTGINYHLTHLAPGAHGQWATENGLQATSLPILETGEQYIQGSSAIIDWAEQHATNGRTLIPVDEESARNIERRCDDIIGVHTRRMFYSEALVHYPETVEPIFLHGLPEDQQSSTSQVWPFIREAMIEGMDLGETQGDQSRQLLEKELDWLDNLYADGRRFLCGDHFSRADLAASSLLAPVAGAPKYPAAALMKMPPNLAVIAQQWLGRPSMQRVLENYRQFR